MLRWLALLKSNKVMSMFVLDHAGTTACVSTKSLQHVSSTGEGFGDPQIALEFDIVILHGEILGLEERLFDHHCAFLSHEVELLDRLVDGHAADEAEILEEMLSWILMELWEVFLPRNVPHLFRAVFEVFLLVADELKGIMNY